MVSTFSVFFKIYLSKSNFKTTKESSVQKVLDYIKGSEFSFIFNCTEPYFYNKNFEKVKLVGHPINQDIKENHKKAEYLKNFGHFYESNRECVYEASNKDYKSSKDGVWYWKGTKEKLLFNLNDTLDNIGNLYTFNPDQIKQYLTNNYNFDANFIDYIISAAYMLRRHPFFIEDKKQVPQIINLDMLTTVDKSVIKYLEDMQSDLLLRYSSPSDKSYRAHNNTWTTIFGITNLDLETKEEIEKTKKHLFGSLVSSVLFDCKTPSYLSMKEKINKWKLETILELNAQSLKKLGYICVDNIWREINTKTPIPGLKLNDTLTINLKHDLRPVGTIYLAIFNEIDETICNDYMKMINHPAHVEWGGRKAYKSECNATKLKDLFDTFMTREINVIYDHLNSGDKSDSKKWNK